MPGYNSLRTYSSVDSKKRLDYFQRRKVGSIRDNPKLLKIKQQFETGCQKCPTQDTKKSNELHSAPSSISLSKNGATVILDELLQINSNLLPKSESKSQSSFCHNRRRSEGDSKYNFLSIFNDQPLTSSCKTDEQKLDSSYKRKTSNSVSSGESNSVYARLIHVSNDLNKKSPSDAFQCKANAKDCDNVNPKSSNSTVGGNPKSSISSINWETAHTPVDDTNPKSSTSAINRDAPPIPKRGISSAVPNDFINSHRSSSKDLAPPPKKESPSIVQNVIQMYEGMSSENVPKVKPIRRHSLRREDSASHRSYVHRRNSRRNSFRKSKCLDKIEPSKTISHSKDDSGVSLSDNDQTPIYQTLTVTNVKRESFNPYDRLNRLHDVETRIHKGQSSNCAACKAIPASVLQYRSEGSSVFEVKCDELSPHHHPPCICFSCQHSVFSCSENMRPPEDENQDTLYYNVCCLNAPNRGDSWRQSRRRPVCEKNGRLCIVNCDMEKCSNGCGNSDECYERLSECHSLRRDRSKQRSGESCDSDEGWVDVTDSEDEKLSSMDTKNYSTILEHTNEDQIETSNDVFKQNSTYDINLVIPKVNDLNIFRAVSTEHLYECIADIEDPQSEGNGEKENVSNSSQNSISNSSKTAENPENDLDSGEWSTESASPVFDESANKCGNAKSSTLNQYRFTVNIECQETAKKNFMKSVLGKKTVNTKKGRMSNFFVPWLVPNSEYGTAAKNTKPSQKKSSTRSHSASSKNNSLKNKRSQSVPSGSSKTNLSSTKDLSSSSDLLDNGESGRDSVAALHTPDENNTLLTPDSSYSTGSIASSAYLRPDQLQLSEPKPRKVSLQPESSVDVSVQRVCKRSLSRNSDHSYIVFQPVKEEDVPLYQFYERNVKERISFCRSPNSMSPIMWSSTSENYSSTESSCKSTMPQLSVVEQLSPDAKDMKMLWCELPEVKESGILERISAQELKLQEAIFEFIQSQASFVRSLRVLYENFIRTAEFSDAECSSCVLSKHEHDVLFSDIIRVKEVSERLLNEVTERWSDAILIPDVCDIIFQHASSPPFSVYVRYCSNRVYQERTLKELKESRLCFLEVLRKLESNPVCQGLSLESFLFLPMQHIARLPLLLDNVFRWFGPDSPTYGTCKMALEAVHKIFVDCNEGARKMERLEEMFFLNKQIEFKECKAIPLISASRWLLKKGEVLRLELDKKTFSRSGRCTRLPIHIFLFNDLLLFTKRKHEDCYTVIDYCLREKVQAMAVNAKDLPFAVPNSCRYLVYLTLFHNHQGVAVDMYLNCSLLSERIRWIEAIHNIPQNKPCEVWEYDCPQVQCVRSYIAQQPDELSLQESDVVTIHRKMNDGWYEGRRLRDGLQGWFPASYTMDIPCSRARASNLKQCYRLLMLSQNQ